MSDPFIGEIRITPFNFAPTGWAMCNGQLLAISSNTALFSLIGTTYGGNGTTNFALPNLQGRVPIHNGSSSGTSNYVLGQSGGVETTTLTVANLPAHTHALEASTTPATSDAPTGDLPAVGGSYGTDSPAAMAANAIASTGSNQPVNVLQPYLTMNFIIATAGIFPTRS